MNTPVRNRICPVEHAGALELNIRRLLQNPKTLLRPYINENMTVLDVGCGPGFFTLGIAELVGESGKVIAADVQEGMLEKLAEKVKKSDIGHRIQLHACRHDGIALSQKVDFILVFYVLHEVPDQEAFLKEIKSLLRQNGKAFIVEPKFHVSEDDFLKAIRIMKQIGFTVVAEPKVFFSRAVLVSA